MKILVTGGCGFLGSHVCELFKGEGWDVVAYDNLTKFEYSRAGFRDEVRDYNLRFLESIGVPTIVDDIRNLKMLKKAVKGCNLVAHCAAQPAMTIAIEDPQLDLEVNVQGTLNVLEACREWSVPIATCSTIHIYGNGINEYLVEKDTRFEIKYYPDSDVWDGEQSVHEDNPILLGTLSPLHVSKRTVELYTQAYADTYGLRTANFRLTGIYGPRQFGGEDHGWVANFTIKTILGQPIKIFGTDKQVRDILYVEDAAKAFLDWYDHCCVSGTYNIGGGEQAATSIHELLNMLEEITGKRSKAEWLPKRHGDLWWFVSDCDEAKKVFDWSPRVTPLDGISSLVRWVEKERRLFE